MEIEIEIQKCPGGFLMFFEKNIVEICGIKVKEHRMTLGQ